MTRPNCSLTRNHSSIDHPCPPYSGANRPPFSRAAIASRLTASIVSSGSCPPSSSASSSSGISTVSTNVRARCWSSSWSDVSSWPADVGITVVLMLVAPRYSWRAARRAAAYLSRFVVRRARGAPAAGCGGWRSRRSRPRGPPSPSDRHRRRGRRSARRLRGGSDPSDVRSRAGPAARSRPPRRRPQRRSRRAPRRSVATAAGSSRSGSGVTDSQGARLTMGGRLTQTDHKVRI